MVAPRRPARFAPDRTRAALAVVLIAAAWLRGGTSSAEPLSWHASGEAGPELDTNVLRESEPEAGALSSPVIGPLFQVSGGAGLKARLAGRHLLSLDYGGGGKVFMTGEGRPADELVQYADAGWGVPVLGGSALWVSGSYYDAFQRVSTRDFRTGTAGVQLAVDQLPAKLRATFDLGYRGLGYKPLPDYSFNGLVGGVGLSWRGSSGPEPAPTDWEVSASYAAGVRFFAGPVIALPERCTGTAQFPCAEDASRRDLHHQLRLEASYLGSASAGLAYTLEVNRSNSYGESFTRHALGLRFTAGLGWGLFMTAKATLQLSRFQDPLLVSQVSTVSFTSIDDENRSSLLVQLSRDLADHWAINLRWALYVNESASSGDQSLLLATGYLRQTLFLGVRFEYGS